MFPDKDPFLRESCSAPGPSGVLGSEFPSCISWDVRRYFLWSYVAFPPRACIKCPLDLYYSGSITAAPRTIHVQGAAHMPFWKCLHPRRASNPSGQGRHPEREDPCFSVGTYIGKRCRDLPKVVQGIWGARNSGTRSPGPLSGMISTSPFLGRKHPDFASISHIPFYFSPLET